MRARIHNGAIVCTYDGGSSSRSVSSFIPLKELVDLFSQLFAEHEQGALARLIANALAGPPHHFDSVRVRDLLPRQAAIFAVDQPKNRIQKPCPCALVDTGACQFQVGERHLVNRDNPRFGQTYAKWIEKMLGAPLSNTLTLEVDCNPGDLVAEAFLQGLPVASATKARNKNWRTFIASWALPPGVREQSRAPQH